MNTKSDIFAPFLSKKTFWIVIVISMGILIACQSSGNKKTATTDNQPQKLDIPFQKQGELVFLSKMASDTLSVLDIEIAQDDAKRARGLMYRGSIPQNAGMLFVFDVEEMQSFWMKNTFISLDMIFVNSNKEIVTIHANTSPVKEWSYASTKPALYVVEVNAGYCNKNNITEGDKIDFFSAE